MSPIFSPGARLGRYEIKSQLGAGGIGEVFLAQEAKLEKWWTAEDVAHFIDGLRKVGLKALQE